MVLSWQFSFEPHLTCQLLAIARKPHIPTTYLLSLLIPHTPHTFDQASESRQYFAELQEYQPTGPGFTGTSAGGKNGQSRAERMNRARIMIVD